MVAVQLEVTQYTIFKNYHTLGFLACNHHRKFVGFPFIRTREFKTHATLYPQRLPFSK